MPSQKRKKYSRQKSEKRTVTRGNGFRLDVSLLGREIGKKNYRRRTLKGDEERHTERHEKEKDRKNTKHTEKNTHNTKKDTLKD
jgi:hypothetical protein